MGISMAYLRPSRFGAVHVHTRDTLRGRTQSVRTWATDLGSQPPRFNRRHGQCIALFDSSGVLEFLCSFNCLTLDLLHTHDTLRGRTDGANVGDRSWGRNCTFAIFVVQSRTRTVFDVAPMCLNLSFV
jgi:hypothetical protein